jgi:uncharacterized membrane protein YozB (DUF420 family)
MEIIMSTTLFGVGGMMLLFAYLIGVRKMYNLISGVNTATAEQKAKMNLPVICKTMGISFAISGTVFLISGALAAVGIAWVTAAAFGVFFLCMWITIVYIQRFDGNNFNEAGQPKKRYYFTVFGISALMIGVFAFVIVLFSSTISSPKIVFSEEAMKIKGMYGTDIAKSEITEVTLIDQPVPFSAKTNGSAVQGAYKGNFTSTQYGSVLVYAKESSLPWICILRNDDKVVLIALQNPDETNKLYAELKKWMEE